MKNKFAVLVAAVGSLAVMPCQLVFAADEQIKVNEELIITGIRENRKSSGATGLDLSVLDTPQSLSIIESTTIENFGLDDINNMLKMTTGVNVDSTETDRTYYNARGFDITSMHVDGIGVPFGTLIEGDLDTAIYEKVEVLRGSNGLITGLGNPGGTVNYVRKRPTNDFDANLGLEAGRWSHKRIVADVSTPLTETSSWAARAIAVYEDGDSWLERYQNDRNVVSIVLDGQVSDNLALAFGYTRQDNNSNGVLWGALPFIYSDGTQASYDVSTSNSMDWTYWNTLSERTFVELGWKISNNLDLKTTVTYLDDEDQAELFYAYWNDGVGLDADTGLGMYGFPGKYDSYQETLQWDTTLQGSFDAWGLQHDFNVGISLANRDSSDLDYGALSGFDAMPSFPGWNGDEVARPAWADPYEAGHDDMTLNRIYGSMSLALSESFKLILGASMVDYENEGISWGVSTDSTEDGSSPYIGFTWELADSLNLYGSYSDIYQPQFYLNESLQPLGSAEGESYELGLKKQFDNRLLVSLALFKTEQQNLQEFVGYTDGDGVDDTFYDDDFNYAVYRGIDVDASGFELEVAGQLTEEIRVQAGYTDLDMDEDRPFIPRETFKLLASWDPNWNEALSLGASARWQSETYALSEFGRVNQDSYALFGAFASYRINEEWQVKLNLDNIFDEQHLSAVKFDQAYYAEPRSYTLSFEWEY